MRRLRARSPSKAEATRRRCLYSGRARAHPTHHYNDRLCEKRRHLTNLRQEFWLATAEGPVRSMRLRSANLSAAICEIGRHLAGTFWAEFRTHAMEFMSSIHRNGWTANQTKGRGPATSRRASQRLIPGSGTIEGSVGQAALAASCGGSTEGRQELEEPGFVEAPPRHPASPNHRSDPGRGKAILSPPQAAASDFPSTEVLILSAIVP